MGKLAISIALFLVFSMAAPLGAGKPQLNHYRLALASTNSWTVYHHDDAHTGLDSSLPPVTGLSTGWASATLDGQVYAEPLVQNGLVFAVTLNNTVYAINQATGTTNWSKHLGAPVTSGWVCGLNVVPQGILGTPVIDVAAGRIYVATLFSDHLYRVYGLDLATGNTLLTTTIPATIGTGFDWKIQQQRGALGLHSGYVYVPFGGRAGDCFDNGGTRPYYGWVVAVPTDGVSALKVFQTPSGAEGAWAAGGIVVDDATSNVFFATGNAIPCSGAMMSDSIVRTTPTLTSPSFFQPNDWLANWCGPDSDLGSASPVLINPNLMFTAGKHGGGFLLDPNNLGGKNGQVFPSPSNYAQADVCLGNTSDATFGSFAYAAPYVYLECESRGLVALKVDPSARTFSTCGATCAAPAWHTANTSTFGPPIVAGGVVWAADLGGTGLFGFDGATGAQLFHSAFGFPVNRFVTPSEAGGTIFVPAGDIVRSFVTTFGSESLGGVLTSGPDAASWGLGRMDVFVRSAGNSLYQNAWVGTGWAGWSLQPGVLTADPGAVSWGPGRIDVFVRGGDSQTLYHRAWTGDSWTGWDSLGGGLSAGPDASSWGPNRLDVFVRGNDNALWHKFWDGGWSGWESLGGFLASAPTAVSWGPDRIDVFVLGGSNTIYQKVWLGTYWTGWSSQGVAPGGGTASSPDISSCAPGHLDVLMVGGDKALWHRGWDGGQWSAWQSLGGNWTSDPSAVCQPGRGVGDAFARGTDNALWHLGFVAF